MQYVTSVERIAKEQGLEQGRQAMSSLIRQQLAQRFGQLPDWATSRLQGASVETLEAWGGRLLEARSLDEIFV